MPTEPRPAARPVDAADPSPRSRPTVAALLGIEALMLAATATYSFLGVSGGASTGAAAAILFGLGAALGEYAQSVLAFLGALGAALIVFLIARAGGRVTSLRLLLSGVAVRVTVSPSAAVVLSAVAVPLPDTLTVTV